MFGLQKSGFSSTPWGSTGLEGRSEAIIVMMEKALELRVDGDRLPDMIVANAKILTRRSSPSGTTDPDHFEFWSLSDLAAGEGRGLKQ